MRCGLLQHKIKILRPEKSKSDYGQNIETLQEHYTTRARVIYSGGSRSNENNEIVYPYTVSFEIWKHVDIKETDYILFKESKYRILSITEDDIQMKKVIYTQKINE